MSKVKIHAVDSKVLRAETSICLSYLISECEKLKDENKDVKEILEIFHKNSRVLEIVTAYAITYALTHKEYIPTIKFEGTVNKNKEIENVKEGF